jgi:hypothetical protein
VSLEAAREPGISGRGDEYRGAARVNGIKLRKTVDYSTVCTNLHRLPSSMTVDAASVLLSEGKH